MSKTKYGKFISSTREKVHHSDRLSEERITRNYDECVVIESYFYYDRREIAHFHSYDDVLYFNSDYINNSRYSEVFSFLSQMYNDSATSEYMNI